MIARMGGVGPGAVSRRTFLAGGAALPAIGQGGFVHAAPGRPSSDVPPLTGAARQGGYAAGRAWPNASIHLDGTEVGRTSRNGLFIVGFDRDAPPTTTLEITAPDGRRARRTLDIAAHAFPTSRVDGLPPATVEPEHPALLERIREEAALKALAFASDADRDDFAAGFVWPLDDFRVSSEWGAQRVLNGTPARPHYGIDLAAPEGSVIHAPADGLIVMARPDMHFEGGLTAVDHGQGLISLYLHQSALEVADGDRVARGQVMGRVGRTGRATGPHLCWRLRWRDRNLDPTLLVGGGTPI